uniref:RNA-dependent RNA polymerase n=1 Tax=Panagrolaimus sp. ES5 TaxID=591445 RepID=A0AC34FMN0_9BILA
MDRHQHRTITSRSNFALSDQTPLLRTITPPSLLTLTKRDYENAKLTGSTILDCTSITFGFTAESYFYHSGILKVQETIFSHHQQTLQITGKWQDAEMKVELRYGFFSKMNFEIRQVGRNYNVRLVLCFTQTPLFSRGEKKPGEPWTRFSRFDPQKKDDEGFWRMLVGSTAFEMSFLLDKSKLYSFLNSISSISSCSIVFTPMIDHVFNSFRIDYYYSTEMQHWPWKVRYCVDAIKSCGTVGLFFMDYVLFTKNEYINVKDNRILNESWAHVLFTAIFDYLMSDISLSSLEFNPDKYEQRQKREDGFVMIPTVYITPTRKLLTPEEATMNCRGFRKLGVDNLIQIKFRDDSLSRFPVDDFLLHDIVQRICRDGIEVAGKKFLEFGGSSSLFREHGSYFYATDDKDVIVEKWKSFGDFKVEAAAKVQARLGQYFTSARELRFKIRQSNVCLIEDYMSDFNDSANVPYCFSDGCGMISPSFARRIADELQLSYVPSAFQFRFAGYKGIVAVDHLDPRLIDNNGQFFLLLRHSQKKFHVEDTGDLLDFDVVQWSSPTPSRLHGAFIAMVDALAIYNRKQGAVRSRLRQLHNETFIDIIKPLIDNRSFLATLEKLPKYIPISKMKTKNLLNEPFLRGMIEANAVSNARLLANKNQIAIPPDLGRGALGIVDTTGSLKEGQVFFQFSKSLNSKASPVERVLKVGRVGVTKSPIYHVGDIRYLEAVDAPALMDKVDVIVFPAAGKRPHTDEIGGGDIDGDWYTIFWDPQLLLERHSKSNDYTAPSVEDIEKVDL